jgi:hypothetical protein
MFLLDLPLPTYVPFGFNLYEFHCFLVQFLLSCSVLILLKKKRRLIDTALFYTANTDSSSNDPPSMPWIDATRPPHHPAMLCQYLRLISL